MDSVRRVIKTGEPERRLLFKNNREKRMDFKYVCGWSLRESKSEGGEAGALFVSRVCNFFHLV